MGLRRILCFFALLLAVPAVRADLVVVANPRSGVERLSQEEVINIFLGRYRRLASGLSADPIDMPSDSEARTLFYRNLVGKSPAEINAYWSRLVFSGKTQPPRILRTPEEALQHVAGTPGALAYLERAKLDKRVVIVYELGD